MCVKYPSRPNKTSAAFAFNNLEGSMQSKNIEQGKDKVNINQ